MLEINYLFRFDADPEKENIEIDRKIGKFYIFLRIF